VAVAVLLAVVVLSYRQTCHAYPSGGGAFVVSLDNFGEKPALTAAAALLVDYVMTVAVSVMAGVLAITSKFPSLQTHAVLLSVCFVAFLALVNLRGLQDSGRAFAVPTYAFILLTFLLLGTALTRRLWVGDCPWRPGPANISLPPRRPAGI
jgi:amino acid transporter